MTDLLSIGASGLRAYRVALATTGDNIANAQTVGYARRSVRLEEVAITGATDFRYRSRVRSDGVDVAGTVRAADAWRTSDARLAASASCRSEAIARWMTATETAMDDSDSGTGATLARMFAAGDALAADPASRSARSAFLASVDETAQSIRANASELARTSTAIAENGQAAIDGLNSQIAALADLNLAIRRAGSGTTAQAELADQRDRLVDGITAQTDVTVTISADGSATLTRGATTLVDGGASATLAMTVANNGRLAFTQTYLGTSTSFQPVGGALAGLDSVANTVAGDRAALDTLASDLANAINVWHANGRTPANVAGGAMFDANGGAAGLVALISDPAQVAAANAGGVPNGNALALAGVRNASATESQWAALVSATAQGTAAAKADAARTMARQATADAARDAVEGVDLDREAADLLRFQQAYDASAKVIQMAKETIDTILRLF